MEYYYSVDGSSWIGPVSAKELKSLAKSGVITPTTLIMSPDRVPPTPAHKAKGLFDGSMIPQEQTPVPVQTTETVALKGILGNAFSFVSGAVSTVTTAIVPRGAAPTSEVAIAPTPPAAAVPTPTTAQLCPVAIADDEIGPFVLHRAGGTQIYGRIDPKLNPKPLGGLRNGKVDLYIHQRGIRMEQWWSGPFFLKFVDLKTIQPIKHKEILSHRGDGTLISFFSNLVSTGPIAAVFAGLGSQYNWELKKDFLFFEDRRGAQLLLEVTEHTAALFCARVQELCA